MCIRDRCIDNLPDLVIVDYMMPELDGFETTRALRAWEREEGRPRTHIIAMTANALSDDRRRCLDSGMNDFLAKPFKMGVLEALLRKTPHLTS